MSEANKPGGPWGFIVFSVCILLACAVALGLYLMWRQIAGAFGQ